VKAVKAMIASLTNEFFAQKFTSKSMLANSVPAMRETKGPRTRELANETVFSRSLANGGYPFEIGNARLCILPLKFVGVISAGMPLTKSVRFTQTMSSLLQLPHWGETSSHFFLRARHVRQPEFDFSRPIEAVLVSTRRPILGGVQKLDLLAKQDLACGGSEAGSIGSKIVTGFSAWR
jgi:hypothetical protein